MTLTALGLPIDKLRDPIYHGNWGLVVLHGEQSGIFQKVSINPQILDEIAEQDIWLKPGDKVEQFTGANESIGTLVLHCATHDRLINILNNISDLVTVKLLG